jgi:glycerate-2-kinase
MKDLEEEAKSIFLQMLNRVDPAELIKERFVVEGDTLFIDEEPIRLSDYAEVILIGFGKASASMGVIVEERLKGWITKGLLITNRRPQVKVKSEIIVAGHPLPDSNSLMAGRKIIDTLQTCDEQSLIIFLISGGGSALVESPLFDEITLEDIKELNRILISCGASIQEINAVRKHLSKIKGGRLGFLTKNSKCIALYISDVNNGDMKSIASNPLLPEDLTLEEFYQVIGKYSLLEKLPASIRELARNERIPRLPKWFVEDEHWHRNVVLAENRDALRVIAEIADRLGYEVKIDLNIVEGDYRKAAEELIRELSGLRQSHSGRSVCLISGGEVSCPVVGRGTGGRNQEFVLYAASRMAASGLENSVVLSCGTDGIDGSSLATGAVLSVEGVKLAGKRNVDMDGYFQTSDSQAFFLEFGGLVVTGPTGSNVRDIRIMLAR